MAASWPAAETRAVVGGGAAGGHRRAAAARGRRRPAGRHRRGAGARSSGPGWPTPPRPAPPAQQLRRPDERGRGRPAAPGALVPRAGDGRRRGHLPVPGDLRPLPRRTCSAPSPVPAGSQARPGSRTRSSTLTDTGSGYLATHRLRRRARRADVVVLALGNPPPRRPRGLAVDDDRLRRGPLGPGPARPGRPRGPGAAGRHRPDHRRRRRADRRRPPAASGSPRRRGTGCCRCGTLPEPPGPAPAFDGDVRSLRAALARGRGGAPPTAPTGAAWSSRSRRSPTTCGARCPSRTRSSSPGTSAATGRSPGTGWRRAMAEIVDDLLATGRLTVLADLDRSTPASYDLVVNCTGPAPVSSPGWNPLVDNLAVNGMLWPGPFGLGRGRRRRRRAAGRRRDRARAGCTPSARPVAGSSGRSRPCPTSAVRPLAPRPAPRHARPRSPSSSSAEPPRVSRVPGATATTRRTSRWWRSSPSACCSSSRCSPATGCCGRRPHPREAADLRVRRRPGRRGLGPDPGPLLRLRLPLRRSSPSTRSSCSRGRRSSPRPASARRRWWRCSSSSASSRSACSTPGARAS